MWAQCPLFTHTWACLISKCTCPSWLHSLALTWLDLSCWNCSSYFMTWLSTKVTKLLRKWFRSLSNYWVRKLKQMMKNWHREQSLRVNFLKTETRKNRAKKWWCPTVRMAIKRSWKREEIFLCHRMLQFLKHETQAKTWKKEDSSLKILAIVRSKVTINW